MKILRIASILVMVSLVLIAAQDKKKPKPPQVEQKVIVVPGNQAWTDTGLTLRPQDRVTITASDKVCFNSEYSDSCVGPEGWNRQNYQSDWPGDYYQCDDPLPPSIMPLLSEELKIITSLWAKTSLFMEKEDSSF